MNLPRPDAAYIRDYREYLRTVWSEAHSHWSGAIDPWYWRTKRIWPAGSARSQMIPSTARSIVEHAADTQLPGEPKFTRYPVREGRTQEKDADDIEAAMHAIFVDASLKNTSMAFKQAGKYLCLYGYTVVEGPVLDLSTKPKEPTKKRGESDAVFNARMVDFKNARRSWNPIRIRCPHPSTVLLDPLVNNPSEAVHPHRMFVKDIKALLDHLKERDRKPLELMDFVKVGISEVNQFQQVDVTEYWSDDYHGMTINDNLVFLEDNIYGFCPYNHTFAGFGQEVTADDAINPTYLAQGLLDPILDSLLIEAQSFSAKHTVLLERAYPRRFTLGEPAELTEQLAVEDGVIQLQEKDEYGFVTYPEVERGLSEIDRNVASDIELGTYARNVAGIRQQGVSTVGQQAILSTAATRKFASVQANRNHMATVVAMNILKLVNHMGEVIEVAGKRLDPKQMHDDYNIVAEFQVIDPVIQQAERDLGMREYQMGLISAETYMENILRLANISLERKRLIKEKVRQSPAYIEAIGKVITQEDGMDEALNSILASTAEGAQTDMGNGPDGPMADAARSLTAGLTPDTRNPRRVNVAGLNGNG